MDFDFVVDGDGLVRRNVYQEFDVFSSGDSRSAAVACFLKDAVGRPAILDAAVVQVTSGTAGVSPQHLVESDSMTWGRVIELRPALLSSG